MGKVLIRRGTIDDAIATLDALAPVAGVGGKPIGSGGLPWGGTLNPYSPDELVLIDEATIAAAIAAIDRLTATPPEPEPPVYVILTSAQLDARCVAVNRDGDSAPQVWNIENSFNIGVANPVTPECFIVPTWVTLRVAPDCTFRLNPQSWHLTNRGTIEILGTLIVNANATNAGSMDNYGTINNRGTLNLVTSAPYRGVIANSGTINNWPEGVIVNPDNITGNAPVQM